MIVMSYDKAPLRLPQIYDIYDQFNVINMICDNGLSSM